MWIFPVCNFDPPPPLTWILKPLHMRWGRKHQRTGHELSAGFSVPGGSCFFHFFPIRSYFSGCHIACCVDKLFKLRIGHFMLIYEEGVNLHNILWQFVDPGLIASSAHGKFTCWKRQNQFLPCLKTGKKCHCGRTKYLLPLPFPNLGFCMNIQSMPRI